MDSDRSRITSGKALAEDARVEASIRPQRFEDFIGQSQVKANLQIAIEAAIKRGEALDHVLLYGPPGLGKTTLANILARQMGSVLKVTSGPLLDKKGDLTAVLLTLKPKDFFFIDEIHRLRGTLEEVLYPAMEDYRLDVVVGLKTHGLPLSPFTLVATTTRPGMIAAPLRARFGIVHHLEFYSPGELEQVIERSAAILKVPIEPKAIAVLSKMSRGTPRIANRLLRRVRDFAEVRADGRITQEIAEHALRILGIDGQGLDNMDRRLLSTVIKNGGTLGLNALAATLREDEDAIEEIYEPYLLECGLLQRTLSGRVATALAYKQLGIESERRPMAT